MSTPPSVQVPWRFVEKPPDGADAVLWQQGLEAAHSGRLYLAERDFARARKSFEQALDTFLRTGDESEAAVCKGSLGDIAFFEGRVFEAIELQEEACATARGIADTYVEALFRT